MLSVSARRTCVLKITDPVSPRRYKERDQGLEDRHKAGAGTSWQRDIAMHTYSPTLDSRRQPLPSYDSYMTDQTGQTGQTAPAYPSGQADQAGQEAKKFEAAKNSAGDRNLEDNTPNGGPPQYRGPLEGGATGGSPTPGPAGMTGVDKVGGFVQGEWDITNKGVEVKKVQAGATAHIDQPLEKKGVGVGVNDGKVGVANGDAYGGSVTTPASANKAASSSSSSSSSPASDGTSGAAARPPYKDPVPDSLHFYKLTTPPQPQINDLGPSTNDGARFGDDLAQRV
jgi:hypothetical protein